MIGVFFMSNQKFITQKELVKKTGLKHSQIDYLVREGQIPVKQFGKAIPRKFPAEAIEIIEDWKQKRGLK